VGRSIGAGVAGLTSDRGDVLPVWDWPADLVRLQRGREVVVHDQGELALGVPTLHLAVRLPGVVPVVPGLHGPGGWDRRGGRAAVGVGDFAASGRLSCAERAARWAHSHPPLASRRSLPELTEEPAG